MLPLRSFEKLSMFLKFSESVSSSSKWRCKCLPTLQHAGLHDWRNRGWEVLIIISHLWCFLYSNSGEWTGVLCYFKDLQKTFRHCSVSALRNICVMGVSRVDLLKLDCKIGQVAFKFCIGICLRFLTFCTCAAGLKPFSCDFSFSLGITILGLYRIGGVNSKVQKLMNTTFCKFWMKLLT